MKRLLTACAIAAMLALPAAADIERRATVTCTSGGDGAICWAIWPALPTVPGWHQDEAANFRLGANILVRDGQVYAGASTILCGNLQQSDGYKPEHPGATLLDGFIADDLVVTKTENPAAVITELAPIATANGTKLRTFLMKKIRGNHSQIVSYTEDRDADGAFFVMLMVDSDNDRDFAAAEAPFRAMVAQYKHFKK